MFIFSEAEGHQVAVFINKGVLWGGGGEGKWGVKGGGAWMPVYFLYLIETPL